MASFDSQIDPIYALAAVRGAVCFAARASGLYRSEDGGHHWRSAYESLRLNAPLNTTALAISPAFEQDRTLLAGVPGGILRSTDAAQSWSIIPLPDPPPLISALGMSPAYSVDGFILAATLARGVFYSTDRGETWLTGNFALLDYHVLALAFSPDFAADRTVLIGTETGVFGSSNGGRSWLVADLPYVPVLSVTFAPDGSAYAGTEGDGLYTSSDRGHTWIRSTLDSRLSISLILTPSPQDRLVFADDTLHRSQDAGATWTSHSVSASATTAVLLDSTTLLVGYADGTIRRVELQP